MNVLDSVPAGEELLAHPPRLHGARDADVYAETTRLIFHGHRTVGETKPRTFDGTPRYIFLHRTAKCERKK